MATYRIEIKHEDKAIAFGYDHFCGEFLQIWKRSKSSDEFGPDDTDILVNEDKFTDFSKDKLMTLIAEHGFTYAEMEEAYMKQNASY